MLNWTTVCTKNISETQTYHWSVSRIEYFM